MSWPGARAAALAAALVLAVASRGDVVVLAVLLGAGAWRPLPAVGVVTALAATGWRWSSASLEHIAGAQAILGPAGVVDPPSGAVSSWLAGFALVLATPDLPELPWGRSSSLIRRWLPRAASAAAATVVVAGPGTRDVWVRAPGFAVALALTVAVARVRPVPPHRHVAAVVLGLGALVAVALDAPPVAGTLDGGAFLEGLALAAAVSALVWVAATAVHHVPQRRDGGR